MFYVNPNIEHLNRIFDQNKRQGCLRLDLNENPGGLPQYVIDDVLGDVTPEFVSQYPETLEFTEALARHLGTDIQHICLTNGSSEGIRYIIQAFSSPGGRIVGVTPSYAMFEVYSEMYGRDFVPVRYTETLEMPIERIMNEITQDTELLILLNPNNPMGNVYTKNELEQLLAIASKMEVTVLIDEAYYYFNPITFIQHALEHENIFVTRTFSKLFSMAGCRLGYVVGWPQGIELVQKMCTPHNVNAFAMSFAKRVFEDQSLLTSMIDIQLDGKKYLIDSLKSAGYKYRASAGNFMFIQPKTNAQKLVEKMKNKEKILIKSYANVGELGDCLRVTTGERQYMERFVTALLKLDQ